MCGIAGIIGECAEKEILLNMLKAQKHRGPDNTGTFIIEDKVVLGHNRLSIIDLSIEANQPFLSEDKRFVIVFNGEIYNYLELKEELKKGYNFKTSSDTEVLLASYITWGKDCLAKLNGMFSFAIWDTSTQSLFAARDRFGVKPFYFTKNNDTFYFASEIKTLFAGGIKRETNDQVWASYFAYGSYGMPDETFWKDVQQLAGGHYLEYNEGELKVSKWYCFENEIKKHQIKMSFDEVKKKYKKLLEESIKLRFRADVPIGFNISGGLDSSTLLAFVNRFHKNDKIKAYTFYTNDERYDELHWVEQMISLTNYPLQKILLEVDKVEEHCREMTLFQDEPFGGIPTLAYGEIFKKARKDGVLVLLDGQGMDEQWAGYDYYTKKTNNIIQGVNKSPFKKGVLNKEFLKLAIKPEYPKLFNDELLNLQYRDLFYTKIPRALRFNDRVSMQSSTELREPFLDYKLVEFAFSQPLEYKIKEGIQKYLLRDLVSEYLSKSISFAPKRPLQTPQREWLGNELKDFVTIQIENLISSNKKSWFNEKALKEEWSNYCLLYTSPSPRDS